MATLQEHVIMGHVDEVKHLLNKKNVNQRAGPWTLLHQTVFCDLPSMAECLCAHGANVNAKGGDDETPLHVASIRNRIEVAKVLLAYRANIRAKDVNGKTPLDAAIGEKDKEMVALFKNPRPAAKTQTASPKMSFWRRLFSARPAPSPDPGKPQRPSGSNRSDWSIQQYAQAIADKVTNTPPCEDSGLEAHKGYVRRLGQEIDDKFGFEGMQEVWHGIHRGMGPGPCSDLTRIWDGVGRWQK